MASTSWLPKITPQGRPWARSVARGGGLREGRRQCVFVSSGADPGMVGRGDRARAGTRPVPPPSPMMALDPERPAPAVVREDLGDQRRRDAGARADAGEDEAVGDAALARRESTWRPAGWRRDKRRPRRRPRAKRTPMRTKTTPAMSAGDDRGEGGEHTPPDGAQREDACGVRSGRPGGRPEPGKRRSRAGRR